ncbi:hypothetical protein, partial [Pseudonocardia pini]|uniref:hypothetical protein n=1 Tax=Pseudonocardia pini TaxID=2758030 RepID=UPI0015F00669
MSASVDVRGRTASGGWTEWIPADSGTVALPVVTDEVQGRLVLTGTSAGAAPTVRGVTLTAAPSTGGTEGLAETAPFSANVFATREGLVGGTTANGHVITERDHFVALPSRRALSPRDTSDYSVRVCAPNGKCAFAPVWDVGPWNTRDDYWNPADRRQEWKDLPQGVPQAQAAFRDGYNGGNDQFGRKAVNPAGIDLGDGVFWDALGLKDNSQVQVEYLWTGSVRLSAVAADSAEGVAEVRSAPDEGAEVVGVAADSADVPVECLSGAWARIGEKQFLAAAVLPDTEDVPTCEAAGVGGGAVEDGATGGAVAGGGSVDSTTSTDPTTSAGSAGSAGSTASAGPTGSTASAGSVRSAGPAAPADTTGSATSSTSADSASVASAA